MLENVLGLLQGRDLIVDGNLRRRQYDRIVSGDPQTGQIGFARQRTDAAVHMNRIALQVVARISTTLQGRHPRQDLDGSFLAPGSKTR